jgi:hypothetical protein
VQFHGVIIERPSSTRHECDLGVGVEVEAGAPLSIGCHAWLLGWKTRRSVWRRGLGAGVEGEQRLCMVLVSATWVADPSTGVGRDLGADVVDGVVALYGVGFGYLGGVELAINQFGARPWGQRVEICGSGGGMGGGLGARSRRKPCLRWW